MNPSQRWTDKLCQIFVIFDHRLIQKTDPITIADQRFDDFKRTDADLLLKSVCGKADIFQFSFKYLSCTRSFLPQNDPFRQ